MIIEFLPTKKSSELSNNTVNRSRNNFWAVLFASDFLYISISK